MTNVLPEGEDLRRAVKWVSDERLSDPKKTLRKLVREASAKFDLSPKDADFLERFAAEQEQPGQEKKEK